MGYGGLAKVIGNVEKLWKKSYPHPLFIWIFFRIFKGGRAGID
jgi:hypothetical protein